MIEEASHFGAEGGKKERSDDRPGRRPSWVSDEYRPEEGAADEWILGGLLVDF